MSFKSAIAALFTPAEGQPQLIGSSWLGSSTFLSMIGLAAFLWWSGVTGPAFVIPVAATVNVYIITRAITRFRTIAANERIILADKKATIEEDGDVVQPGVEPAPVTSKLV